MFEIHNMAPVVSFWEFQAYSRSAGMPFHTTKRVFCARPVWTSWIGPQAEWKYYYCGNTKTQLL